MSKQANKFGAAMPGDEMEPTVAKPVRTGRLLILFDEDATAAGMRMLTRQAGLRVSLAGDEWTGGQDAIEIAASSQAVVYQHTGVAVASVDPDQMAAVSSASAEVGSPILATEVEEEVAVNPVMGIQQADESATWGLDATGVLQSGYSGAGVKVAILDTGFDLNHADFANRTIIHENFITTETIQDGHGHGTHCTGTACGPLRPRKTDQRYGIAYGAQIYVGKVLNQSGAGTDNTIIAGINWAIEQGCHIVSMSIGGPVSAGATYSNIYETVAYRALRAGTLIIAAAGNDSRRLNKPSVINPVSRPANCPSILAVAAVDRSDKIAKFSNGSINVDQEGAEVDVAGPGVDIYSSWPGAKGYNTISGTSMATPHVAGIAALCAEANPNARGRQLWDGLLQSLRPLNGLLARDVGAGFVVAP
ncbi:MAG: S8 family serine peptidase [Caldilineaceae bacterium]